MKTIGKITTFIIALAVIATCVINTAIHIKSGEAKDLFSKNNSQIEQPVETSEKKKKKSLGL